MLTKTRNWLVAVILCLIVDRFLKQAALDGFDAVLLGPSLVFRLFKNMGIAFSLPFSGPPLWIVSLIILIGVGVLGARELSARRTARLPAYAFFLCGAISNLFDRVVHGYTVDYLIFFSRSAVNVADGMILLGALWLLFGEKKGTA